MEISCKDDTLFFWHSFDFFLGGALEVAIFIVILKCLLKRLIIHNGGANFFVFVKLSAEFPLT